MAKLKDSLLWSFSRSSSKTNYILGSMHVKSDDAYTPVSAALKYMSVCKFYAGEMDLNDPHLDNLGDYFLLPDEIFLTDLLPPKKFVKYQRIILKSFGIDINHLLNYKPIVISNMIAESLITKSYDLSLDHYLWEEAQGIGMTMRGLESAEDQFEIMEAISIDNQLKALKSTVQNVPRFRKKILKMSELYSAGELNKLYKMAKRSMGDMRKMMIYDRNKNMADRLIQLTADGATFSVVGAAHLPGSKGILRHLKKAGFIVKSIPY